MRARVAGTLVVAALAAAAWVAAAEPRFSSTRPLYAYLVVDQEAGRLLKLVFDESGGTGKGYDTLWADLDLDGDLTNERPLRSAAEEEGEARLQIFPELQVAYVPGGALEGEEARLALLVLAVTAPGASAPEFVAQARLGVRQEGVEWEYAALTPVWVGPRAEGLLGTALFCVRPRLEVAVEPDPEEGGKLRVSAVLQSGISETLCRRAGGPLRGMVEIRNAEGEMVFAEQVTVGGATPPPEGVLGPWTRTETPAPSFSLEPGVYTVEVEVDTGPLGGVLKGTRRIVVV